MFHKVAAGDGSQYDDKSDKRNHAVSLETHDILHIGHPGSEL